MMHPQIKFPSGDVIHVEALLNEGFDPRLSFSSQSWLFATSYSYKRMQAKPLHFTFLLQHPL